MSRILILVLLSFPTAAFANVGLPMLAIVWPMSVPALIPVVAVESWVVRRALNVSWRVAVTQMVKGNLFSTLVGIPLAWVASVAVEFFLVFFVTNVTESKSYPPHGVGKVGGVILTAPWLAPYREGVDWIIPLAMIVLLVPFFFASFLAEAWYVGRHLCPEAPDRARRAIWNANAVSYIGLLIASVCWLAFGVAAHA